MCMNDQREEDALFKEWQAGQVCSFIRDGVFDWPQYRSAKRKICFVLLEAYDDTTPDKTWNLQELRKKSVSKGHTDATLTRWAYGLSSLEKNPDWESVVSATRTQEGRKLAFGQTAQINLRKNPETQASTDMKGLKEYVDKNWQPWLKERLRKQWEIYQPHITVCGGWLPFWCAYKAVGGQEAEVQQTANKVEYWSSGRQQIILKANHPAARISAYKKYITVVEAVREIFQR